jgi:hypothetical protein
LSAEVVNQLEGIPFHESNTLGQMEKYTKEIQGFG